MDRFYFAALATVAPGCEVRIEGAEAHHLARVKRLPVAARVLLFDGEGGEAEAEVVAVERDAVRLVILSESGGPAPRELATRVVLGVAPPKGKRAQILVEKATEIGAAALFPLATERSVVDLRAREDAAIGRWRRWAIEAAKQSGTRRIPELAPTRTLAEALGERAALRLILDPRPEARPLRELLAPPRPSVLALVGPEGGFTDAEVERARAAGFSPVRIGPTVLRTETAAIAALAAIAVAMG